MTPNIGVRRARVHRDAELYVRANVERIRELTGDPSTLVHVIGGIGHLTTPEDIRDMTRGATVTGAIGLSLYDVGTTGGDLWGPMRDWRQVHEPGGTRFVDVDTGSPFGAAVEAIADRRVTRGCNPPANDLFCPGDVVTRAQMAAFLTRALRLPDAPERFTDVAAGDLFAGDIGALASAGITRGCNPPDNDRFCPDAPVTRREMASFLARAFGLPRHDETFRDVASTDRAARDIGAIQAVGITVGCNPPANDRFCPDAAVTRVQMATFLHRALSN